MLSMRTLALSFGKSCEGRSPSSIGCATSSDAPAVELEMGDSAVGTAVLDSSSRLAISGAASFVSDESLRSADNPPAESLRCTTSLSCEQATDLSSALSVSFASNLFVSGSCTFKSRETCESSGTCNLSFSSGAGPGLGSCWDACKEFSNFSGVSGCKAALLLLSLGSGSSSAGSATAVSSATFDSTSVSFVK